MSSTGRTACRTKRMNQLPLCPQSPIPMPGEIATLTNLYNPTRHGLHGLNTHAGSLSLSLLDRAADRAGSRAILRTLGGIGEPADFLNRQAELDAIATDTPWHPYRRCHSSRCTQMSPSPSPTRPGSRTGSRDCWE